MKTKQATQTEDVPNEKGGKKGVKHIELERFLNSLRANNKTQKRIIFNFEITHSTYESRMKGIQQKENEKQCR